MELCSFIHKHCLVTFNSNNNEVSIVEDGKEEKLESPNAYVAYSKSGSVTVSDSKKILEM